VLILNWLRKSRGQGSVLIGVRMSMGFAEEIGMARKGTRERGGSLGGSSLAGGVMVGL
jgi:hypothetical protein